MSIPTGGVNLGSAYGLVGAKFDDRQVRGELGRIDTVIANQLNNIGSRFSQLGSDLSVGLAPITAFVTTGVLSFMKFDDVLTEIEARTGATAEQMELVRAKALQMGQDTAFSATDASQAILELLSSGYDLEEAFLTLEPTLNAAAAGSLGLGEAADAVTDILAQFRMGAEDANTVVDALAAASSSSSATFRDLVQGFANVGPVAANMGMSIEETAAVLAVFAENGIKGSEAGTQLRSMLNNMTRDVPEVKALWDDLGVSMYDMEGNARPLNDVIQDLNVAMAGMSDEDRNRVIKTLAGSFGQMGLSALLAADGIEGMQESMSTQANAATVAAARMSSFKGVINQLKSSIETLSINVLGPFVDRYLKPLVQQVIETINSINGFIAGNEKLAATIGLVLAVLGFIGPALLIVGKIFAALSAVVTAVGAAFTLLTGPIGLVIGLAVLLYAAYKKNLLGIGDFVDKIADSFGIFFKGVKKTLKLLSGGENVFTSLRNGMGFYVDDIARKLGIPAEKAKDLQLAFQSLLDRVRPIFAQLASFISRTIGFISGQISMVWNALKTGDASQFMPAIENAFNNITTAISRHGPAIAAKFAMLASIFWDWLAPVGGAILVKLGSILLQIAGWIGNNAPVIAAYLLKWAAAFGAWALNLWQTRILPWLIGAVDSLLGWIADNAPVIAAKLVEWATAFGSWAINIFSTKVFPWLLVLGTQILNWIAQQAPIWINQLAEWAVAFASWAGGLFLKLFPKLLQFALDIGLWILSQIPVIGAQLLEWAWAFTTWAGGLFLKLFPKLLQFALDIGLWILSQIPVIGAQLLEWAWAFTTWAGGLFLKLFPKLLMFALELGMWVASQIPVLVGQLLEWGWAFVEWAVGLFPKLFPQLLMLGLQIGQWILDQIPLLAARFVGWVTEFVAWISNAKDELPSKIAEFWDDLKAEIDGLVTDVGTEAVRIGTEIVNGVKDGIDNNLSIVTNTLKGLARAAIREALSALGIASPSKVFADIGLNVVAGFAGGISSVADTVGDAVGGVVDGMSNALSGLLDRNSPSKMFEGIGTDVVAGLTKGINGSMGAPFEAMKGLVSQMQAPLSPATAGMGGNSVTGSNNTYYVNVEMTPPAEVFANQDPAQIEATGSLLGRSFADELKAALRNQE